MAARFDEAYRLVLRRTSLAERFDDPDHLADIAVSPIRPAIIVGRFDESRSYALLHDQLTAGLTPHHRVHGVGLRVEEAAARADWDEIDALQRRTEQAVAENLATPCILNARSLLACAHARLVQGDATDAERLERAAAELGMEGYERALNASWIGLALRRGDLDRVARLLEGMPPSRPADFVNITTSLDAYAALRDRARVENDAQPWLSGPAYYRPFALRALGIVRDDGELLAAAADAFDALALGWYADETRALLDGASFSAAFPRRP